MTQLHSWLTVALAEAKAPPVEDSGSSDVLALVFLGLLSLFFVWLVVAVIRKKLSSAKGRIGELSEEDNDASQTARLWSEAKRRIGEDEPEDEESEEDDEETQAPAGDIQSELLERARKRKDDKQNQQEVIGAEKAPSPDESISPAPTQVSAPAPKPVAKTLEDGLQKTREGFVSKLGRIFGRGALSESTIEEVEEILFTADIGVRTSQKLIDMVQKELTHEQRSDSTQLYQALQQRILQMLSVGTPVPDMASFHPHVTLVVGVNGTGKTTTIGKLAMRYTQAGKKVVLAAGDTFRAAAGEQLEIWGQRAGASVISGQSGSDPGAVIFDAINAGINQGADMVIADTAGRLHTKVNLIEELRKVHRVCDKALKGAPHEVLLVLDATTGQNAINQTKEFHEALKVTGIILTKLDGTAKGGVIIGICDSFGIPVRYIGIGEQAEDLRPFDPNAFVKALFA